MTWKPKHEAHAIERVRLLCTFREPLPSKAINRSSSGIIGNASDLGFNSVEPAQSSIQKIRIDQGSVPAQEPSSRNGHVMKRHKDGQVAEEVGFRDMVYGYMTTTYGRWDSMKKRLDEVFIPALEVAGDLVELKSVKLEYWDSFFFDGDPQAADISNLLEHANGSIPKDVLKGSSTWHSHAGWFEDGDPYPTLINRNFDMVDQQNNKGQSRRALGIYTLVEKRFSNSSLDMSKFRNLLEEMHNRSLLLFGGALSSEYRKKVGIDLESYK